MAVGFSGSNGGIGKNGAPFLVNRPLEVSYFINNVCNLKCKHCYVGYEETDNELPVSMWKEVFDKLIGMGALTFGNVGKEPLLSWDKTLELLSYFAEKRHENKKLRFGFVTNGYFLSDEIVDAILEIVPDYIDVSLDGVGEDHDNIRGRGNYGIVRDNLKSLPKKLKDKVFISHTLNSRNRHYLEILIREMNNIDISNIIISPYIRNSGLVNDLEIDHYTIANYYDDVISGKVIDFSEVQNFQVLLKADFDTQRKLITQLVEEKVIDTKNLLVDDYGVIYNNFPQKNGSEVKINYMPFSDTFSRAIRISHDGYVSGCEEMFHKNYPQRARGNVKEQNIEDILSLN